MKRRTYQRRTRRELQMLRRLGENIRDLRETADLSQREMAFKIKKSKAAVHQYEMGEQSPPIEVLYRIAAACKVEVGQLLP